MRWLTIGCVFAVLFASLAVPAAAETAAAPSIAQQGLTLFEVDKELARLQAEEQSVTEQIEANERSLQVQEAALQSRGEAVGRILRSYYVGHRDRLWLTLFNMRSFRQALVTMDYLQAILRSDVQTLRSYQEAVKQREELLSQLEQRKESLRQTIVDYEFQRFRLIELQAELDRQLAALTAEQQRSELERIRLLTTAWEQQGIPIFEDVLGALSAAMSDLPQMFSDGSRLKFEGTNIQIWITESEFNAFLQERNALFQEFQFSFTSDGMSVTGQMEDQTATITGSYVLQSEPSNLIRFRIDTVVFNDYELPDTTRKTLEEKYNLTFEPGRLLTGLKISEVAIEEERLQVKLTLPSFSFAFRQ